MSQQSRPRRWWLGVGVMAFGAVWLYGAQSVASTTHFIGLGPSVMISAVGAGLVLLGLLLAVQEWRGIAAPVEEEEGTTHFSARRFALAAAGISLPLLAMVPLGFPITAMGTFALVARAFGSRRLLLDLVIGAVLGALLWWLFSKLGVQLGRFLPLLR